MKFLQTAIMALFLSAAFIACKKNDVRTPSFKMEGAWEGKIGQNTDAPSGQYKINIKNGGTIERINSNGTVSASGSWNMAGENFTAIYFYSNGTVVNVAGTTDKSKNKLTATWSNNGDEEGTLYFSKQ
ncbi:MAG: hypothetical protein WDO71_09975 [Bacteroidota bacterium]